MVEFGKVAVIVPVRNGGTSWRQSARALRLSALPGSTILIVDSESSDESGRVAEAEGFQVLRIKVKDFNHGRTRQWAINQIRPEPELVIFLTHDAVLTGQSSFEALLECFSDPAVGAAYGRQLPRDTAGPLGTHARLYNYPARSEVRSAADIGRLGIKAAFLSNSFAAYRISALRSVGGFPDHLILGEDTVVAVRMLLAGYKISYCSEALVKHSHDYTLTEDFQRYFDIGVLHSQAEEFSKLAAAEKEGRHFVASELRYLLNNAPWVIWSSLIRTLAKYAGYRLGRRYEKLSIPTRRKLSMTKGYWLI